MDQVKANKTEEKIEEPIIPTKSFPHGELLKELYFLWDNIGGSGIDFFVVRDTAKKMREQKELDGDHIDIGIRKLEWNSESRNIFEIIFENENVKKVKESENEIVYEHNEILLNVHLYDDNECLSHLNSIQYEYEAFKIPNQFEKFEKYYDHA